jgi:hypothetical protein
MTVHLPAIADIGAPLTLYDTACKALAEARSVDEVQRNSCTAGGLAMTRAALAVLHLAGPGFAPSADGNIVWWPDPIQRRAAARVRDGGPGRRRPPGDGRVVLWPWRFWPQRSEDIDAAIIMLWKLYSCGVIDTVELTIRDEEFRTMRGWFQ